MGMPPIYRLKHWLSGMFEAKSRPAGVLSCATCHESVTEGAGSWDAHDGVVLCGPVCVENWATDRSY